MPEDHASELHVSIDYVEPETSVSLYHEVVDFDEFLVHEHVLVFEAVVLEQRMYGHVGVDSLGVLVSYSQQKQEYVFEVYDADHHS